MIKHFGKPRSAFQHKKIHLIESRFHLLPCIASYLMFLVTCYRFELAAPFRSGWPVQKFVTFRKVSVVWICLVFIPLICFLLFSMKQNVWSCFRCSSFPNVHISFPMFGHSTGYDILVILHREATCFQSHQAAAAGERYGVLPSTSKVCDQGSSGVWKGVGEFEYTWMRFWVWWFLPQKIS